MDESMACHRSNGVSDDCHEVDILLWTASRPDGMGGGPSDFERFRPLYGNDFSKLNIISASCPKQERGTDCGPFFVKYADMLMNRENLADFDPSTLHECMKNWSINLCTHG
ncbi:hypothetical protein HAX54_050188 [Datura stramonium]|uniref:Ubiquitin-like protease family profile domain-containing protein n=1 Tax=Datura stramonium TaxID=4076 RepID=A0ABS8SWQ5_DATST|nr:hypothetical protein [Datura stramonium]